MDPAGPFFYLEVQEDRLARSDAEFVEVLHTDAGRLGFEASLGHADYWSNGGHEQVGCPNDDIVGNCSHGRAFVLFAESLISGKFNSTQCETYKKFESGACNDGVQSYFGEINPNFRYVNYSISYKLQATCPKSLCFIFLELVQKNQNMY